MPLRAARRRAGAVALTLSLSLALVMATTRAAVAAPFIWDQDQNHLDDRIETVHALGYSFAFELNDTLQHKRIDVANLPGGLVFGVYVEFLQTPTPTNLLALAALGMPVLHRFEEIPAVRSLGTFAQVQAAKALPGVDRVEAIPILYPMLHSGTASAGVRDPSGQVFPTWSGMGGASGEGVVVAILDTGINDDAQGSYPGHESLIGRCVGGANFTYGDSSLDTPRGGSVNPTDHGGAATSSHGTHVAGIILGNGGSSGFAIGVAPQARFVDVKVLNDVGVGTGIAEALDWCIHNRTRDWGAGADYQGIDVINLSLSNSDESDGNDVASRLADRAVQLGMVVVASVGNDGKAQHVPSPAGGDRVLAVGAFDNQRTPLNGDDAFATFSNYGPRAEDGDVNAADEQKPDLLASGVAVLSADGDLSSDGAQYHRLTGTSMAAAFVTGAVAALRSAYPSLTPDQIAQVLRATAYRPLSGVPPGLTLSDPGWYSPIGFGALDLHAAYLELAQPERSQVRRLELHGTVDQITATVRTMRERGTASFVFERAPDVAGVPGTFAPYDSVAAAGDSTLADGTNMQSYSHVWNVPLEERGVPFWYRIAYTEGGVRWSGPSRKFSSPSGPPVATVEVTVVHNAYDNDIDAAIDVMGTSPSVMGATSTQQFSYPLPPSSAAVSSEWVTGASTTGNVAWSFAVDIPAGAVDGSLPPDVNHPWRLRVGEGGYLNRVGRVTAYRVIWHAPGGDQYFPGTPLPLQTLEGATVYATAPSGVTGVEPMPVSGGLRMGPNPSPSGGAIEFSLPASPRGDLRVFDLIGREVGRVPFRGGAGEWRARWEARDGAGRLLPAGLYFARAGEAGVARLVVLAR